VLLSVCIAAALRVAGVMTAPAAGATTAQGAAGTAAQLAAVMTARAGAVTAPGGATTAHHAGEGCVVALLVHNMQLWCWEWEVTEPLQLQQFCCGDQDLELCTGPV
jgi:hypothetical protein